MTKTATTTRVITYQHAYLHGAITLCAEHAENPPEWVPALGPVEHGEHEGYCSACEGRDECED